MPTRFRNFPQILLSLFVLISCAHTPTAPLDDFGLTKTDRTNLFSELVAEMERLDAQALDVRAQTRRPTPWQDIVDHLRQEFIEAKNPSEYTSVFERLNLAYTNGHAELHLGEHFTINSKKKNPAIVFQTFWTTKDKFKNQIVWIDSSSFPQGQKLPNVGDEIISINDIKIEEWFEENFNFCKYPLKNQCNSLFADQFLGEKLSWAQSKNLKYTIKDQAGPYAINVPLTSQAPPSKPQKRQRIEITEKIKREYPGFKLVYTGENAFVYESITDPKKAILRITSFGYWPNAPIKTPFEEVEKMRSWWQGNYRHLILDLTENRGGNDPLPYFRILFDKSVNNVTRVRFKKINEFFLSEFQESLFWGDPQRLAFINDLKQNHWNEYAEGALLPPEPYVCGRPVGFDCQEKYSPYDHKFKGKISVLISKKCMSSCDEFVLTLKKYFGRRMRLIGQPQFSDTGFSRLRIAVMKKPINSKWTQVLPFNGKLSSNHLLHQEVVVTQSVDDSGKLIDGKPMKLDAFVPYTFENQNLWYQSALKAAL